MQLPEHQPPPGSGQNLTDPLEASDSLEAALPVLRQRLLRHAKFALRDESLAEDLVQDTLIAVVEQHELRRKESTLATWATAILKNKVADWYRSPHRNRVEQLVQGDLESSVDLDGLYGADGGYAEPVAAWQQPENREEQRQMMSALERCVSCLPTQSGRVFMMREWLGFETSEICERLALSADNCRMILHRARMALRQCMQRNWTMTKVNE